MKKKEKRTEEQDWKKLGEERAHPPIFFSLSRSLFLCLRTPFRFSFLPPRCSTSSPEPPENPAISLEDQSATRFESLHSGPDIELVTGKTEQGNRLTISELFSAKKYVLSTQKARRAVQRGWSLVTCDHGDTCQSSSSLSCLLNNPGQELEYSILSSDSLYRD